MVGLGDTWLKRKTWHAIAGVEIGVVGGLVMLLWLILSAPLVGEPWWTTLNLFASHYYPYSVVRQGPGMVTLSGSSFLLVLAGSIGGLTGLMTPGGRLFGLGVAIAWYLLSYGFLWKKFAPMLVVYGSQPLLIIAFFLYGSALGWHPDVVRRIYNS